MGFIYKHQQEQVSKFIFKNIKNKEYLDFNFFYDGTNKTHKKVNEALGYGDNLDDETPIALVDLTIEILESYGVISIETLHDLLPDGENNFRIRLTEKGKKVINNEIILVFRDY